jgi:hypothetical protein
VKFARYFIICFTVLLLITAIPLNVRAQTSSADADLVYIHQGAGSLSPAFSPSVTEYLVRMSSSLNGYYTATKPSNPAATMEYSMNGGPWIGIPSYTSTGYLPTNRGDNTFQIMVTSVDLTTTKTYTIHVYYPPTNDANLRDLRSDQATLTPAFQPSTTDYTANVPYTTSSISFAGMLDDPAAYLMINGTPATDGALSGSIPLNVGSNTISIATLSFDHTANKTYTITVTRSAPGTNTGLSNLTVPGYPLSPAFATGTTAYTVSSVVYAVDSLTVIPTAADSTSTVKVRVNGGGYTPVNSGSASRSLALNVGSNTIEVQVTAQDGTSTNVYTISTTRLQDNTVNPASATFDKYSANTAAGHYQDVVTTLVLNGNTLSGIKLDGTVLGASSYTLSGNTVTIHKEYLATLETGNHVFAFEMNKGMNPMLSIFVSDTTPPVLNSAVAGDGHVNLAWSPVDGSSGYKIYQSLASGTYGPEVATVTGSTYGYDVTGLTNGTACYFVVKATNPGGDSTASNEMSATPKTVPAAPTGVSAVAGDSQATGTAETVVNILVNGKAENWGLATTTRVNNQAVTTIALNPTFMEQFAAASQGTVITIPFSQGSDVVIGELTGQMVKILEQNQAVLKIQTDQATYTLPARQINLESISNQLGQSAALQDIIVQIEIGAPAADMRQTVENAASKGNFKLAAPPLTFTVRAAYHNSNVDVSRFNAYVERTIAIPDGVDANQITTGIVVEPDGSFYQVPTMLAVIDGKYYVKINSLSNSTYAIVSHPVEFQDVASHWAKSAVNGLGSRMIISGIGNGMFAPDQDITRAEFAAILVRGLGLKLETGETAFPDVKATDWYHDAIQTAYAYHFISGFEDGSFHPTDKVTREQAMAMIAKAMTLTGLKTNFLDQETNAALAPFQDTADVSHWARNSIAACLQSGIVSGRTDTELAPKAFMTRAEVAVMIQKFLQKSGLI